MPCAMTGPEAKGTSQQIVVSPLARFREAIGLSSAEEDPYHECKLRAEFRRALLQQRHKHDEAQRTLLLAHRKALQQQVPSSCRPDPSDRPDRSYSGY